MRSSLGTVIRYADNPDKTTNPKYLDDDLAQVLRYAENDDKTDQWLFVTGIHCTAEHALVLASGDNPPSITSDN